MRLHRPVLAGLVLGSAVLPVTAASAATGVAAAGEAVSSATIASISVGAFTAGSTNIAGHTVSIGSLAATAQTLTSAAPAVSFVPVTVDGAKTGAVTVTPANSPQTVGGITSAALPLNVLSATSPAATLTAAKAASGPMSKLDASLGQVNVLGLPVTLNGALNVGSATDAVHSQAGKALSITNVTLPSIADVLGALGIDMAKLPADTLSSLVEGLPVTLTSTGLAAFNAANDAVDTAGDVDAMKTQLDEAQTALNTAKTAMDSAMSGALGVPPGTPSTAAGWDTLDAATQAIISGLNPAVAAAAPAYTTAKTALAAAQTAYEAAVAALAQLASIVKTILDGTPLVSIGKAEVGTKALVGSAKSADVTGYVSGVKVLGEDVLATALGNTKVDAAKLVGDAAAEVNATIAATTATLSEILSSATGAVGLAVPAPTVQVLTKQVSTGTQGAFGIANASVTALSIGLGSATIPRAYALDAATNMAGIAPTATGFKTAPLSIKVGTLAESAKFRPGTKATTPTTTPDKTGTLPSTGLPTGLGIVAVIGTAIAVGARRRLATATEE